MNKMSKISKFFIAALAITALILPQSSFAIKHVVAFGGCLGAAYCPSYFSANIGDTVQWKGSFAKYTLNSTLIPRGADSFHIDSGTTFSYIIKVGGIYNYKGNDNRMHGCFYVHCWSAVRQEPINQVSRNSFAKSFVSGGRTFISLNIQGNELVTASILSVNGEKLATLINNILEPGVHSIPLNGIKAGTYIVRLSVGNQKMAIKTFITR